jgi:hypothetical protein
MAEGEVVRAKAAVARLEPQALIERAIDHGASVEALERLFNLAQQVRAEQAREAWHGAMAEFQRTCKPIKKSASMTVPGRKEYAYAPLDSILSTIQPAMGDLGLSVSWRSRFEPQHVIVSCRVSHMLGHHEDSGEIRIPVTADGAGANAAQRIGTATTYAKRYSLLGILGLAPEDDDDAASASDEGVPEARRPRPREEHQAEVDEMHDRLLVQIGELADAAGWTAAARRQLWQEHFGEVQPAQATPAQLADFLAHVRNLTK